MPLIGEPINPVDENNYGNRRIPGIPNMPVDTPSLDPLAFKEHPGQMVISNPQPIHLQKHEGKPGFFSTFGHAVGQYNEFVNAGKFITQTSDNMSHLDDPVEDGWKPDTYEAINGFPENYWPGIWSASSPKDQQARQERARAQMKDDEYYANGSMVANIGGALFGGITSPSTWLIPAAAGIKYASFGQNLVRNAWKALPSASAGAIAAEGFVQAGREGGNMQDWAVELSRYRVRNCFDWWCCRLRSCNARGSALGFT